MNLSIFAVDGETLYWCHSTNKGVLLGFLREYDHEGAEAYLQVDMLNPLSSILKNEEAYRFLQPEPQGQHLRRRAS